MSIAKFFSKTQARFLRSSDEIHLNGKQKDEPLRYTFEISLEQLLYGTQRQLEINREIREINRITETKRRTYTITIEAGCKEEHIIRLAEVGDRDPINIPADLLITIRSKPHLLYKRQGADLIYTKVISYVAVSLTSHCYGIICLSLF